LRENRIDSLRIDWKIDAGLRWTPMSTVKDELKKVVAALPKDATWDDAIERILLRKSCEQALDDIDAGRGISNETVLHNAEQ